MLKKFFVILCLVTFCSSNLFSGNSSSVCHNGVVIGSVTAWAEEHYMKVFNDTREKTVAVTVKYEVLLSSGWTPKEKTITVAPGKTEEFVHGYKKDAVRIISVENGTCR